MLNPETMTKAKEKEHFKEFMEDFNTGTINEKYADLAKWEKKQAAIRNGETIEDNTGYDPRADLECEPFSTQSNPLRTASVLTRVVLFPALSCAQLAQAGPGDDRDLPGPGPAAGAAPGPVGAGRAREDEALGHGVSSCPARDSVTAATELTLFPDFVPRRVSQTFGVRLEKR